MKLLPRLFFPLLSIAAAVWPWVAPSACAAVDTVTTSADSGPGSLRNTIATAGPGDTIVFVSALAGRTIQLTSGELYIGQNLTIDASTLPEGIIIDGYGNDRVLEIGGGNVAIKGLTFANGYVSDDEGAGVLLDTGTASLTASNCAFYNGTAEEGGGIFTYGALTLNSCVVSNNSANVYGGGIYNFGGAVVLNNCTLFGNSVYDGGGGGIESENGMLTLNSCIVSSNVAAYFGGGVDDDDDSALAFTNCMFLGNFSGTGGGLSADTAAMLIGCTFSNNVSANGAGGGLVNYATLTLNDCTLAGNSATNGAGGGLVNGDDLTANNCIFLENTATNGGAIVNVWQMTLNNCRFDVNSVTNGNGGGIYNYETLSVSNCNFLLNTAVNGNGGAIYNAVDGGSTLALADTAVNSNAAGGGVGGGIANGGILTADNSFFSGNTATNGGGIFNAVGMTLNNCTLCYNSASSGSGGGVYGNSAYTAYGYDSSNAFINCTICDNSAFGSGGGLYNDSSSTLALTNTIVASNSAFADSDVYGVYSGAENFIGGNPLLAPEGNYGGTTPTMPPEFGSPVIDAGTDWVTNFLTTDERGFPRFSGRHVDIGAVEAQIVPGANSPVLRNLSYFPGRVLENGSFQFSFTNVANADFTVLTSTNLALPVQWTVLGNVSQSFNESGQFYFVATVPTATRVQGGNEIAVFPPMQFFRVVSP